MSARALALVGLAAAVVTCAVLVLHSVRRLDNRAAAGAELTGIDREFPAARQYDLPSASIERLASVIPRDAVYTIVPPGQRAGVAELAFQGLVANYLLPRRDAGNEAGARYVIAYRQPVPRERVSRVIELGDGVELGVIRR